MVHLETGSFYRARTVTGEAITFRVVAADDEGWPTVDLFSPEGPEPNVWLNTRLLQWIAPGEQRESALSLATEETIEALEVRESEP